MTNGAYDVFGEDFGLGLPIGWFDAAAIEALLTAALTSGTQIDQLIIGWDGEPSNAWDEIRTLLRSKGYFPAYTATGAISFARARLANVLDIATATTVSPLPRRLNRIPAVGDGVDRLVATLATAPWYDGQRVEVNLLGEQDTLDPPNSLRNGIFADSNVVELDLSCLAPIPPEEAFQLAAYVAMRGLALDTLEIRANDPGTVAVGDIVKVGDPNLQESWFTDESGDSIEVDSSARWYGQVVGFRRNLLDDSIDLDLRMNTTEFERVRAPAAVVASVASNVYTCDANHFKGPLGGGSDVEQFTVGDFVEVWTEDGVRKSGTAVSPNAEEITAIGTNTITVDTAFTTPPVAGNIIRIAHLSTADGQPETGGGLVSGEIAYAFSADATAKIGPNNLDAHIYGYGAL